MNKEEYKNIKENKSLNKEQIIADFKQFFNFKTNEKLGPLLALLLLAMLSTFLSKHFLSVKNILNIYRQYAMLGITVIGMTCIITVGCVDLSAGSTVAFCGIIIGLLKDQPFIIIFAVTCLAGLTTGFINGYMIAIRKVENYIATLSMQIILRGLCLWITHSSYISDINSFKWLANGMVGIIPLPVVILVFLYIFFHILTTKTVFGKNLYAVGGNSLAAKLSGVNAERVKISTFMIGGLMYAFAALLNVSRLSTAEPLAGVGLEADAVAATLVGGASLAGGLASISGSFIGLSIFAILYNIMNLLGVQSAVQQVAKGLIILVSVLIRVNVGKKQKE